MSRFVSRPFLMALGLTLVLFAPVFEAGRFLGWSSTVAGWWSLFVIGLSSFVWSTLAEREEKARKDRDRQRLVTGGGDLREHPDEAMKAPPRRVTGPNP